METVIGCVFVLLSTAGKFKTSIARVPYNKLTTNLASSSHTGEFIVSELVEVNPDNSQAMSVVTFLLFKLNTLQKRKKKLVKV